MFWSIFVYVLLSFLFIIGPRIPGITGYVFSSILLILMVISLGMFYMFIYSPDSNADKLKYNYAYPIACGFAISSLATICLGCISLMTSMGYTLNIFLIGFLLSFVILFHAPIFVGSSSVLYTLFTFSIDIDKEKTKNRNCSDLEEHFGAIYLTSLYSIGLWSLIIESIGIAKIIM